MRMKNVAHLWREKWIDKCGLCYENEIYFYECDMQIGPIAGNIFIKDHYQELSELLKPVLYHHHIPSLLSRVS